MEMQAQASSVSLQPAVARPTAMEGVALLIARLMMAQIFIVAGTRKMLTLDATIKYMGTHLPMPDVLVYAVVALELGGGILFALGWRTRQLAALLGAFCIVAGLLFHQFWVAPDAQYVAQLNNFMKNVAIGGGFLLFVVIGGGRYALDRR